MLVYLNWKYPTEKGKSYLHTSNLINKNRNFCRSNRILFDA